MKVIYSQTPDELGRKVAAHTAALLRRYISEKGSARLLLSTGASQLTTFTALLDEDVDWSKVEVFHLDEYIDLPSTHPASFIKYLKERFIDKVQPKAIHYVDTSGDIDEMIARLTQEINKSPIDVGLIGIGENAHIAFNDPPADFESTDAYIIVTLAESCRRQQFGEGWFPTLDSVPDKAVTMTVKQILKCKHILSAVPFKVKAQAIYDAFTAPDVTPEVPSTALRNHDDVTVYIDEGSASLIEDAKLIYKHGCEKRYPHADDVLERLSSDGGFAGGWALHQKPVAEYFFDSHVHYCAPKDETIQNNIDSCMKEYKELEFLRALVIFNIYGDKSDIEAPAYTVKEDFVLPQAPWITIDDFKDYFDTMFDNDHLFWSAWIDHREPNPKLIHSVAKAGAVGIKLHNAPVIETNAPYDVWLSDAWSETFNAIDECKLPVLFHVTQRLPSSKYTGGGRNVYWEEGWKNGVTYNNEDLLQAFLTCCRRFPNISFIGAHQLHIGWERLDELFTEFPNLYVDTTIGCMLRLYDNFYEADKEFLRRVFIKWADRIIFGTDALWCMDHRQFNMDFYRQHIRFITSLDLPGDALNKICHGNTERLYNIKPL